MAPRETVRGVPAVAPAWQEVRVGQDPACVDLGQEAAPQDLSGADDAVPDDDGDSRCHLPVCGRDGGCDRQRVRGQLPVTHCVSAHAYLGENSSELDMVGQGVRGMPLDRPGQRLVLHMARGVGEQYESCACGSDGEPSSHPCRSGHGAVGADALHEDDLRAVADCELYVFAGERREVMQVGERQFADSLAAGWEGPNFPQS